MDEEHGSDGSRLELATQPGASVSIQTAERAD
jgi:hypothetical protein